MPIVDQEFSSDSSYQQSLRRDVVHSYDTFTQSEDTGVTPEGYRAERRRQQIVNMEVLVQKLVKINQNPLQGEEDPITASEDTTSTSEYTTDSSQESAGPFGSTESSSSKPSNKPGCHSSPSTQGSSSFEWMLWFPLSRIVESTRDSSPVVLEGHTTEAEVGSSESEPSIDKHQRYSATDYESNWERRICIEELSIEDREASPLVFQQNEEYYIPLAQSISGMTEESTLEDITDTFHQGEWGVDLRGLTERSVATEDSSTISFSSTSYTPSDKGPVLEILTSPTLDRGAYSDDSSRESSAETGDNTFRGVQQLHPPDENHVDDSSSSVPTLYLGDADTGASSKSLIREIPSGVDQTGGEEFQALAVEPEDLPRMIQGFSQGIALSPVTFMSMDAYIAELEAAAQAYYDGGGMNVRVAYHGEFYESMTEDEQLTFTEGNWDVEADSIGLGNDPDPVGLFYEEVVEDDRSESGSMHDPVLDFEGDTIASTGSEMPELVVRQIDQRPPQITDFVVEIPEREFDDPPDQGLH